MAKSFREALIGAWKLQDYYIEDKVDPEKRFYPLGKDVTGFILYTPDGYVSAQMMAAGRPPYASGRLHTGTMEEMAQAAKGYMAYSGQYEVDESTSTCYHHMQVSMNPTWEGQTQKRFVTMENDTITITNENNKAVLVWKRAEDHSNE